MEVIINWVINVINLVKNGIENHTVAIITLATVATAVATIVIACTKKRPVILTQGTSKDNQQMRVDAQKPAIAVYPAEYNAPYGCVGLVFENTGAGPALDVEFEFNRDFKISSDRTLGSVGFLRGADYIPAKYYRKHQLCVRLDNYFNTLMKQKLSIEVTYRDSMRNKYKHPLPIDFNKSLRVRREV